MSPTGQDKGKEEKIGVGPVPAKAIDNPSQVDSQLRVDLAATKNGLFGNPWQRLETDITKRLGVRLEDALKGENITAYSNLPDIKKTLDKIRARRETKQSKLKKDLMPLNPDISAMSAKKLLSLLTDTKRGWFGDPEKRLRSDIAKRLDIAEENTFDRESLLTYSRFKDVAKTLDNLIAKKAKEKEKRDKAVAKKLNKLVAKKAKEKEKAIAKQKKRRVTKHVIKFVAANPAMEKLFKDLLQVHKGLFGNPEDRLRKAITKRMGVPAEDVFKNEVILSYSTFEDVARDLNKLKAAKTKKEEAKVQAPGAPVPEAAESVWLAKPAPITLVPGGPVIYAGPEAQRLMTELLQTKRGAFGSPEKKLRKDVAKRLKIDESEALKDTNIVAYAKLSDVQKKLEKVQAKEEAAAKKAEAQSVPKPAEKLAPQKPEPYVPLSSTLSSDVTQRAKKLQEIMEERKQIEAATAKKKAKPFLRVSKIMSLPLILLGKGIDFVLNKISHVVFVLSITILSVPLTLGRFFVRMVGGLIEEVSKRTGKASPLGWRKKINQLVIYSGLNKTQEEVTGIAIVNGTILALVVAAAGFFLLGFGIILSIIAAVVAFGAVWVVIYAVLIMMADKRTDEVEGTLPDVLQIVGANISAGMTPYNALWVSARKEFGALAEEIKLAQRETLGGKPFTDALTDMSKRVRSNILQRTIRLIIQGMKAGGELPNILQGIGSDIRQMRLLQKEMAANTMSYTLFILFGMILGAPLLFSVSIQFVDIMNRFQPEGINTEALSNAQASPMAGGMQGFDVISLGRGGCPRDFDKDGIADKWEKEHGLSPKNTSDAMKIDPETNLPYLIEYQQTAEPLPGSCITAGYLSTFAMIALLSVAFFGSLLVGLIRSGKQSAGLKLAPLLIVVTLGMFWLMNTGMSFFFGSMFGT